MEQFNATAAIEKLKQSIGKQNMKECTAKDEYEFYKPIYDKPVIIQNNVNNTYSLAGIPKRYYDMSFTWLKENGSFPKENAEA